MGRQLSAFVTIVAALFVGSSAIAQRSAEPRSAEPSVTPRSAEQPGPATESVQISDEELQTFAKIYSDLQESISKHEAQLAAAQTEEEAGKIQAHFQEESVATVSKHGWTVDKFNSVVKTINADPALADRASALIHN